ncbi:MAG TPA: Asp-tRNA(Asn)/Glu-tRNA(Gln) amidotransferase subunit GatB [Candidatus Atribacteria bacterium]|jgi:aspartyl-tRNA(Asn)/glutamyl-tRNA(Gln) amidotransferase subunit B|nr:Asp-tRNA(Asn)/Glu-tRNA(Gln) amidotransferase subunit GatB [Atribacterota bacterium]HPT63302.1 Asp-tRNA(Asn)/Glu-tRNA(Gln) amidotransferase subunit GatB [Candidatus Atribacteria bacterium]
MSDFTTTIGLEVHCQLLTQAKMFCHCSTDYIGKEPNTLVCPVCLGLPGSLPVLNQKVVELALRAALALHCQILPQGVFHRKNYFYPDLPKGYQISQYDLPIGVDGFLEFYSRGVKKKVRIKRVHIEEDAGKLIHEGVFLPPGTSGVDCNRCGIPLAEVVTEPELSSPEEARDCLMMLRNIVCYLGVSDGNMEEGSLRCDANISLSSSSLLGVKVEVKNMNSFRSVYRALSYEVERQRKLLEEGKPIFQETRHWDEVKGVTVSARGKEGAEDYRYFPDPDLLPFSIKGEMIEEIKSELPELPLQREERFMTEYELSQGEAEILVQDKEIADFFEDTLRDFNEPRMVCNWITTEVFKNLKELGIDISQASITPAHLAELLKMVDKKEISGTIAKSVLEEMFATGARAREVIARRGISFISDEKELENIVREVIEKNPQSVADYLSGKEKALQFLIGQVMKETRGQADPELTKSILIKVLSSEE